MWGVGNKISCLSWQLGEWQVWSLTVHHRHGLYGDYKANEGFWFECESPAPIGRLSATETSCLSFVVVAFKSAAIRCRQLVEISKKTSGLDGYLPTSSYVFNLDF